eukprot:TRINITY_DN2777_c0_g1_i1.p1 TRINITY_DN2777_c0_g1~~TRINITY_DN2777_c0_g1_i1.p1  ORF type:complete len:377 (-),score=77.19 TRINITY_DN2777_c0_g1_i1:80-1210(-)
MPMFDVLKLSMEADAIELLNPQPNNNNNNKYNFFFQQTELNEKAAFEKLEATYTFEHIAKETSQMSKYNEDSTPNTDEAIPLQAFINIAIVSQFKSQSAAVFFRSPLVSGMTMLFKLGNIDKDPKHVSRRVPKKDGELSKKRVQAIAAMFIGLKGLATHNIEVAEVFSDASLLELLNLIYRLLEPIPSIRYHAIGLFAAISERAKSIGMFHALNLHRHIMKQGFVTDRVKVYQLSYCNKSMVLQDTWEMSPWVMQVVQNFLNVKELLEDLVGQGILERMKSLAEGGELDAEMTYRVKKLHSTTLRYMVMEEAAVMGMINKSDYKVKSKPPATPKATSTKTVPQAVAQTVRSHDPKRPNYTNAVLANKFSIVAGNAN